MGVFAAYPALTAITALTAGASIYAQRQAAGAQEVEMELAQRQESQAARDREVQRKRRVVALLGSQAASAAAAGVAQSGSVGNISLVDAKRAAEDSMVDDLNTRQRIDALRRRRNTIDRLSRVRTATTILGAGERLYSRGSPPAQAA